MSEPRHYSVWVKARHTFFKPLSNNSNQLSVFYVVLLFYIPVIFILARNCCVQLDHVCVIDSVTNGIWK